MEYVNVTDGVYTGAQVHSNPSLVSLMQFVPKHRASKTILEVKGGAVVEIVSTKTPIVSLTRGSGSIQAALSNLGVEEDRNPTVVASAGDSAEVAALKAQLADMRTAFEMVQRAAEAKPAPAPVKPAPAAPLDVAKPLASLPTSEPLVPTYKEMQNLSHEELKAIAAPLTQDPKVLEFGVMKLRGWLNSYRKTHQE